MSEENKYEEPKLPTGDVGTEQDVNGDTNPAAVKEVELNNPMKQWFVSYIGEKYKPENGVVTVELAVRAMAEEFPEFLMVLAEENWLRGYKQGVDDSEAGVRASLEEAGINADELNALKTFTERAVAEGQRRVAEANARDEQEAAEQAQPEESE